MSFRLRPWWGWRSDPPPCPVDGAPHTTCTSPDYPGGVLTIAVRTPRSLAGLRDRLARLEPPPPVAATVSAPFTTATYRRSTKKKGLP